MKIQLVGRDGIERGFAVEAYPGIMRNSFTLEEASHMARQVLLDQLLELAATKVIDEEGLREMWVLAIDGAPRNLITELAPRKLPTEIIVRGDTQPESDCLHSCAVEGVETYAMWLKTMASVNDIGEIRASIVRCARGEYAVILSLMPPVDRGATGIKNETLIIGRTYLYQIEGLEKIVLLDSHGNRRTVGGETFTKMIASACRFNRENGVT
jgi:hypothetical protein